MTMRFIEGTDLARMIARDGRLPPGLVGAVASQLGDALDAAHARGLVHRDVKPANVLVRESGPRSEAFLTDFGLTRELTSDTRLTASGAVIGTVDYMAPEQFRDGPLDPRTDVYALGCVIYQALTGTVPFPGDGAASKLFQHVNAERPSVRDRVPELPEALDRVVRKAMATRPEDRFQSAGDLGRATAAAIESGSGDATAAVGLADVADDATAPTGRLEPGDSATSALPPEPPPPPPARRRAPAPEPAPEARRRRDRIAIALAVVTLLTGAAVAYVVLGGDSDEPAAGGQRNDKPTGNGGGGPQAVAVPAGAAAIVEAYARGEIERTGFERRAELVRLRDPGTSEHAAREQALDELVLNRWMRGEAAQNGSDFSAERVDAELASPEFAGEAERLRSVGYLEGGIRLDAEARLAAEELFGEGSRPVEMLTAGYDPQDFGEIADLIAEWRPETACAADLAELSPLCVNGPEPG